MDDGRILPAEVVQAPRYLECKIDHLLRREGFACTRHTHPVRILVVNDEKGAMRAVCAVCVCKLEVTRGGPAGDHLPEGLGVDLGKHADLLLVFPIIEGQQSHDVLVSQLRRYAMWLHAAHAAHARKHRAAEMIRIPTEERGECT